MLDDIQTDELYHHGVTGMKWGVRRYQNKDGSLKPLGRKRLLAKVGRESRRFLHVFRKKERQKAISRTRKQNGNTGEQENIVNNSAKLTNKLSKKDMTKTKIRDIKKIPTDELIRLTERAKAEAAFMRAKQDAMSFQPVKKTLARRAWDSVIAPVGTEIAKDVLKKQTQKLLGLNNPSDNMDKLLEREAKMWENRAKTIRNRDFVNEYNRKRRV